MHGLVFKQLKGHVVDAHGRDAWTAVVEGVEGGRQAYLPVRAYPDEEFEGVLAAAVDLDGDDEGVLLRAVGERLGGSLHDTYHSQIDSGWGYFDLLENLPSVADSARAGGDADPPALEVDRVDDDRVTITYASGRERCDLAEGIAAGLATAYGEDVTVTQEACTHDGDRACEIVVEAG